MLIEQDRVAEQREEFKKEKEFRRNVLKKAETYERLSSNKDFQEHFDDLRNRADAHQKCIDGYVRQIAEPVTEQNEKEHPFLRRMRIADLIVHHQTQKDICEEIVGMPSRVAQAKNESLERLNEIERLEKEIPNAA